MIPFFVFLVLYLFVVAQFAKMFFFSHTKTGKVIDVEYVDHPVRGGHRYKIKISDNNRKEEIYTALYKHPYVFLKGEKVKFVIFEEKEPLILNIFKMETESMAMAIFAFIHSICLFYFLVTGAFVEKNLDYLVVSSLMMTIGGILFCMGVRRMSCVKFLLKNAAIANGEISELYTEKDIDDASHNYAIIQFITHEGEKITIRKNDFRGIPRLGNIKVTYDKQFPKFASIESEFVMRLEAIAILFIALALIIAGLVRLF